MEPEPNTPTDHLKQAIKGMVTIHLLNDSNPVEGILQGVDDEYAMIMVFTTNARPKKIIIPRAAIKYYQID